MGCFSHWGNTGSKLGRLEGEYKHLHTMLQVSIILSLFGRITCWRRARKPHWGCPTAWICRTVGRSQSHQGRVAANSPATSCMNLHARSLWRLPSPQIYSPSSRCPLLQYSTWSQEESLVPWAICRNTIHKLQKYVTPVPEGDHFMGITPDWNTEGPCQAKVCQLDLALPVHQQVLWFQIPEYHSVFTNL